ncbi:PDLI2 protein, partial [Amia calva]|nr:PDLI2 protein [Amia calva]
MQVNAGSKAEHAGLGLGDIIQEINGESTADMLNVEAQNKIKNSKTKLQLAVDSPDRKRDVYSPTSTKRRLERRSSVFKDHFCSEALRSPGREGYSSPGEAPQKHFLLLPRGIFKCFNFPQPSLPEADAFAKKQKQLPVYLWLPLLYMSCSLHKPSQGGKWPTDAASTDSPAAQPQGVMYAKEVEKTLADLQSTLSQALANCPSLGASCSEVAMQKFDRDSEVYKMIQENKESRAAPRQSNTFRMLQEVLEADEKEAAVRFPGNLAPIQPKPVSSVAGVQKYHTCEKCGTSIVTQAVRIVEDRYRHPECYTCTQCGLNLKMRGHFWFGDDMFCEKHAREKYHGSPGAQPTTVSPRH